MQPSYEKYVALKESRHLTDFRVSQKSGVPRSTFSDWKSGRSSPKLQKIAKLAAFFQVPIEALLDDAEQEAGNE